MAFKKFVSYFRQLTLQVMGCVPLQGIPPQLLPTGKMAIAPANSREHDHKLRAGSFLKLASLFLAVFLVRGVRHAAAAQSKPALAKIFQVGVFDRSSSEFHGGRPERPVNFVVGQSDPAKDWYADQPSLIDAHGFKVKVHPHEIVTVRMITMTAATSVDSSRVTERAKHSSSKS
jgi:hypothetical protein